MQVAVMIHDMYNIHGTEDSQGVQPFTKHTLSRYYSPNKSITVQSGKVQTKDITNRLRCSSSSLRSTWSTRSQYCSLPDKYKKESKWLTLSVIYTNEAWEDHKHSQNRSETCTKNRQAAEIWNEGAFNILGCYHRYRRDYVRVLATTNLS